MSKKSRQKQDAKPESKTDGAGEGAQPRDLRPFVYAGFDAVFAAGYATAPYLLARSANGSFETISAVLGVLAGAAAVGTVARRRWGWWTAVVALAGLLVAAVILIALLASAAGYVRGVYGPLGRAASMIAILAIFFVVELYGLLPLFQLRYLLSADGRRAVRRS